MKSCLSCRFAIKTMEAFDGDSLSCGHLDARIDGQPVGYVTGEEAERCAFYQKGKPTIKDELVPVTPRLVQVHAAGFPGAGN
jgi:hypothetical protein